MTGTSLERVVNPATGEVLDLTAPTVDLARALADMRDLETAWRDVKTTVTAELLSRLDRNGAWTQRLDAGFTIKAPSPEPVEEFDAAALHDALSQLVDEGVITVDAMDRAIETIVTYKPRVAGLKALRKLGGRVADTIAAHSHLAERRRYITVTRGSTL